MVTPSLYLRDAPAERGTAVAFTRAVGDAFQLEPVLARVGAATTLWELPFEQAYGAQQACGGARLRAPSDTTLGRVTRRAAVASPRSRVARATQPPLWRRPPSRASWKSWARRQQAGFSSPPAQQASASKRRRRLRRRRSRSRAARPRCWSAPRSWAAAQRTRESCSLQLLQWTQRTGRRPRRAAPLRRTSTPPPARFLPSGRGASGWRRCSGTTLSWPLAFFSAHSRLESSSPIARSQPPRACSTSRSFDHDPGKADGMSEQETLPRRHCHLRSTSYQRVFITRR